MTNKSIITRTKIESVLKLEIENIFGRRILSSRDCTQLSDEIFRKTQVQLNPNTLRRFFGLVKADYPASLSTLNILSNYCGFQSLDDVDSFKRDDRTEADCIQQKGVLNYLVSLYDEMPVNDANNDVFLYWVKHTVTFLNNNPGLMEKFQSQILKTRNGQKYYFSHFVNIDKLNSYYGRGLRCYSGEQRNGQAFVFANSLLVYRYWINADNDNMEKHFQLVNNKSDHTFDPSVCGRYFAALLFHAHVTGKITDEIIDEINTYYSSLKLIRNKSNSLLSFEMIVGEALILTDLCKEGLYYIDQALKRCNYAADESVIHQSIYLFQSIALYKMREVELAESKFNLVNPSEFSSLNKKYLTVLYLLLSGRIKRKILKYDAELTSLIQELGFKRIETLLYGVREILPTGPLRRIV